jgi:peptidoglycan/LPS O-acetylase OafA/YrhL
MQHKRIPELDGIRGIGICAVFFLHVGAIQGGFIGVDIFFTLSGFLITSILLSEYKHTGKVSLRRFYYRRALRLFPALAVLLLVCAAWGQFENLYPNATNSQALSATSFYYANWFLAARWIGAPPPLGPLSHAWSLSIEEQFYILWPLILLACLKFNLLKRTLGKILLAGALLSLALAGLLYLKHAPWQRIYAGTDTHCGGLLIGCAVALLKPRLEGIKKYVPIIAVWGIILLCLILTLGNRYELPRHLYGFRLDGACDFNFGRLTAQRSARFGIFGLSWQA